MKTASPIGEQQIVFMSGETVLDFGFVSECNCEQLYSATFPVAPAGWRGYFSFRRGTRSLEQAIAACVIPRRAISLGLWAPPSLSIIERVHEIDGTISEYTYKEVTLECPSGDLSRVDFTAQRRRQSAPDAVQQTSKHSRLNDLIKRFLRDLTALGGEQ